MVAPLAQPLHCAGREALGTAASGRRRAPHRGWHTSPRRDAPASLARGRGDQHRRHRAAQRHIPRTASIADSSRAGVGAVSADAPSRDVSDWYGLSLLSPARESGQPRECNDTGYGHRDHGSLLECSRTVVVSRAAASLDATQAMWASLAWAHTPSGAVVQGPRLAAELPRGLQGMGCKGGL